MFYRVNLPKCHDIRDILSIYNKVLGDIIKFEKSGTIFSSNMNHRHHKLVKRILGVKRNITFEKYLGGPFILTKSSTKYFQAIITRVSRNWKD